MLIHYDPRFSLLENFHEKIIIEVHKDPPMYVLFILGKQTASISIQLNR